MSRHENPVVPLYARRADIGFGIHYPTPVHLMEAYRSLGSGPGTLPVTERAAREVLSLPLFSELSEESARRVIETVRAAGVA